MTTQTKKNSANGRVAAAYHLSPGLGLAPVLTRKRRFGEMKKTKEQQLFDAVYYNDIDEVKALIKDGVNINAKNEDGTTALIWACLLYTSPSPRDGLLSRMPSSA